MLSAEQQALLDELTGSSGSSGTTMELGRAFREHTSNTPPITMPKRGINGSRPVSTEYTQSRKPSSIMYEVNEGSPAAKAHDSGSSSRQSSDNYMLRAVNAARIPSDHDMSYISEERPQEEDFTAQSSRFAGAKSQRNLTNESLPSRFGSKNRFNQPIPQAQPISTQSHNMHNLPSQNNTGTQQSFAIPAVPNYTELVSGVFNNGKPVYLRDARSHAKQRQSSRPDVAEVDDVTVDDEEQAIYLSLQLLRERVAELERESADKELSVRHLQRKNRVLEAEKAQSRSRERSDSAVGLTDGASDGGHEVGLGPRKLVIEKNRKLAQTPRSFSLLILTGLESSLRALQSQVESTQRNAAHSEDTLRNVTKERDQVVSQLGVAYFTIERLEADNARLTEENQALRGKLSSTAQPSKSQQASLDDGQKLPQNAPAPMSGDVNQQSRQQEPNYDGLSNFERFQVSQLQSISFPLYCIYLYSHTLRLSPLVFFPLER